MIRFSNATFTYPGADTPALRDVTLDVAPGEFLLVAGETGAGKSTLLRAACGLVPHFSGGVLSGRVLVAGRDTREVKPRDLADVVGFVAQDADAGGVAATVEDEIAFCLENLGTEPMLMRKRVEETLDALGIAGLRDRRLEQLSGGERQRVAVAAVLVAAPKAVVLDEPTSQLDPQSAEEVLQTIVRLSHDLGIAVIVSEHRLERVAQFADRICIVEQGRVTTGEPRDVLTHAPVAPPVVRLGRALGWDPVPLTVREARSRANGLKTSPPIANVPAPGEERLRVKGVRVVLGGREVVRRTDLSVNAGETLAIVGRNGSGKTTLLRAVVGLVRRAGGTVLLDGAERSSVEDAARVAGYVPQAAERILHKSRAIEEVAETLRIRGLDKAKAAKILAALDLSWAAERDPRDLSAGERTRLALAAMLAADPGVVMLDEPTRGMDEPHKAALVAMLGRWRAEGRAVVLVTHDVELVAAAATRVALMTEGEVVLDGPAREVLGESVMFSSQMNKVFDDRRIATVADALAALGVA
jgi:energy-coupling factor transport system ATP-binding protein